MRWLAPLALLIPALALAGPKGSSHATTRSSSHTKTSSHSSTSTNRDPKQKSAFRKNHPCPSTGKTSGACPGYEVDHRTPLACGGADSPSNMQWLTKSENRSKGAAGCARR